MRHFIALSISSATDPWQKRLSTRRIARLRCVPSVIISSTDEKTYRQTRYQRLLRARLRAPRLPPSLTQHIAYETVSLSNCSFISESFLIWSAFLLDSICYDTSLVSGVSPASRQRLFLGKEVMPMDLLIAILGYFASAIARYGSLQVHDQDRSNARKERRPPAPIASAVSIQTALPDGTIAGIRWLYSTTMPHRVRSACMHKKRRGPNNSEWVLRNCSAPRRLNQLPLRNLLLIDDIPCHVDDAVIIGIDSTSCAHGRAIGPLVEALLLAPRPWRP